MIFLEYPGKNKSLALTPRCRTGWLRKATMTERAVKKKGRGVNNNKQEVSQRPDWNHGEISR